MANKIRVKSENEYVIDVNDNGDVISFDITDTGLTSRLMKTFEKIDELTKEYETKAVEIDKQEDKPYNDVITQNQYESAKLIDNFYTDARLVMDGFLGKGACQKIFGDKNYLNMFYDLTEALEPHFEKIGINAEKLKKTGVLKHSPNRKTRRSLK